MGWLSGGFGLCWSFPPEGLLMPNASIYDIWCVSVSARDFNWISMRRAEKTYIQIENQAQWSYRVLAFLITDCINVKTLDYFELFEMSTRWVTESFIEIHTLIFYIWIEKNCSRCFNEIKIHIYIFEPNWIHVPYLKIHC